MLQTYYWMSDFKHLASSNVLGDWIDYSNSNLRLFSDHGLSYINTVLNSLNFLYADDGNIDKDKANNTNTDDNNKNTNSASFIKPLSSYDNLLAISNSQFNKRLRSNDSLWHFRDHFDSVVNLESSMRQIPPFLSPFSIVDSLIDNYHTTFLNTLASVNETPHEVVKQTDATRLLRYYPAAQNTASSSPTEPNSAATTTDVTPLLMVYAPINRYHILDLSHERSIVQKFVSSGFDVFLLDWGERQSENKPTLVDYVEYMDQSVEQIRKTTRQEKINLYGYSWGGTLSIVYAAIH